QRTGVAAGARPGDEHPCRRPRRAHPGAGHRAERGLAPAGGRARAALRGRPAHLLPGAGRLRDPRRRTRRPGVHRSDRAAAGRGDRYVRLGVRRSATGTEQEQLMTTSDLGDSTAPVPFDQHHYDYSPWFFWADASEEEKREQLELQRQYAEGHPHVTLGQKCFLSPLAAVQMDRLDLGDRCYIAAHAYVTGTLVAGPHCTINPFTVVRGDIRLGHS